MIKKNKYAITILELIIVVSIVAILGLVAYVSLNSYSKNAMNSSRITDIQTIRKSLELFSLEAGKFPDPTNGFKVTYNSNLEAWSQGSFGETSFINIKRLNKIPVDPLLKTEYVFSVTNSRKEYQIASIIENNNIGLQVNKVNAIDILKQATLKIVGNYNGKILKVRDADILHLLAVPSIICMDNTTLVDCIENNKLVYDGFKNLPSNYKETAYNVHGETETMNLVNYGNFESWSGSINDLNSDLLEVKSFINNLQKAYDNTIISDDNLIKEVLSYDTNNITNIKQITSSKFFTNISSNKIQYIETNAKCGSANGTTIKNIPTIGLCEDGTATGMVDHGPMSNYIWNCEGINGGLDVECIANNNNPIPLNGVCGESNGKNMVIKPNIELCARGESSTVVDHGEGSEFRWTCDGINGGGNIECSANHFGPVTIGTSKFPSCGNFDVIITNGNDSVTVASCDVNNYFYQFGNNDYQTAMPITFNDYTVKVTDWGVNVENQYTATYANSTVENQIKMKGMCPNGYHIPTYYEWKIVVDTNVDVRNDLYMINTGNYRFLDLNRYPDLFLKNFVNANNISYGSSSPNTETFFTNNLGGRAAGHGNYFIVYDYAPDTAALAIASYNTALKIRCFKN